MRRREGQNKGSERTTEENILIVAYYIADANMTLKNKFKFEFSTFL